MLPSVIKEKKKLPPAPVLPAPVAIYKKQEEKEDEGLELSLSDKKDDLELSLQFE